MSSLERTAGLDCHALDELAGAWALGALAPDEERAVAGHLATCDRAHVELRDAVGAAEVLAMTLAEDTPSPELRARIMRSIEQSAGAGGVAPMAPIPLEPRRRSWLLTGTAGLAAAAALVVAVWNLQLQSELQGREADLARLAGAIAAGDAAHRASGSAGSGYLIDAENPVLVAALPPAPAGRIYEMWLLDRAGTPVSVGTFDADEDGEVTVVELERPLAGYETFAVTIETQRVDAPSGEPVLAAALSS
jgi:anti-sigma-K factor RskA